MVKIIAEAGINHNGSVQKAIELVKKAKYAGADFVKFQIFIENVATKKAKNLNIKSLVPEIKALNTYD